MAELEEERNSASHFGDISAVKPEGMEGDMGDGTAEMLRLLFEEKQEKPLGVPLGPGQYKKAKGVGKVGTDKERR